MNVALFLAVLTTTITLGVFISRRTARAQNAARNLEHRRGDYR